MRRDRSNLSMVVLKSRWHDASDGSGVETSVTIIDPGQRGRFEVGEEYGLFLVPSGDDSLEVSVEVDVKVEIDGEPLQETATPETKFHCCHCTKEAD